MKLGKLDIVLPDVVTIKTLTKGDYARWNEFVFACPEATFFHRAEWQGIVEDVFGHKTWFLYAERQGKIVGVLPLGQVNSRLFGNSMASLPFAVYGGIAAIDPAAIPLLEREAEKLALQAGAAYLEYRNVQARHQDWPHQDLYVTFRKEILPEVEANMLAIPRKQRAMVRKGINGGLVGEIDLNVNRFFDLYADNVHRHGTPAMPKRYFQRLKEVFGEDCELLIVVNPDGQALSGVMTFYFRDECLPYYAGDDVLARDTYANDFKYWDLLRRACERGLKVFDYGRSKQGTGSFSFKKNWGFEPAPLHYEYRLLTVDAIPQNNPSNPKYKLFIEAWRRMPIGLANFLGPFIVRNLG